MKYGLSSFIVTILSRPTPPGTYKSGQTKSESTKPDTINIATYKNNRQQQLCVHKLKDFKNR